MIKCMKNIYYLFCLVLACLTNLYAEKVVTTEISDDTTHHIELIFPNDWDVELKNNDLQELHIYDNNSPGKMFVVGIKKPTDVPRKVWIKERDQLIDMLFSEFKLNALSHCQQIQFEQKVAYPGVAPVIYEKTSNYLCEGDQKISASINCLETEDHVVLFALMLFDPPTQHEMYARIQAFANCIHIVPNKVMIR